MKYSYKVLQKNLSLVLLIGLSLSLSNVCVMADNLQNSIDQFIDSHPKVTAAKEQLTIAGIDIDVAKDNFMPELRINGDVGSQSYEDSGTGIDSSNMNNNRYLVELSQNLFRGFQDQLSESQAMVKETIAIKNYEKVYQKILLDAVNAYLDVLHYKETRKIVEKKIELLEKYASLMAKAKRSGSKTDVDVYEAQLSLQQALGQQADIDGKYLSALGNYESVFGVSAEPQTLLQPSYNKKLMPATLNKSLAQANNQSVFITLAESNIEIAQYKKVAVEGDYWPTVDLVGSFGEEKNKEGVRGRTKDGRVYLKVEWKYNLGNQNYKKVQSASGSLTKERYNYESVKKEVNQKVRLAWQKYSTLKARAKISRNTLEIANKVYKARKDLKLKGKGNAIAIINSKAKLLDSTIAQINANYESLKSTYALAKEIGNIQSMLQ